jgi:hypothetical protein
MRKDDNTTKHIDIQDGIDEWYLLYENDIFQVWQQPHKFYMQRTNTHNYHIAHTRDGLIEWLAKNDIPVDKLRYKI